MGLATIWIGVWWSQKYNTDYCLEGEGAEKETDYCLEGGAEKETDYCLEGAEEEMASLNVEVMNWEWVVWGEEGRTIWYG